MVSISSFMYLKISRKGMKRLGGRSDQHPCLAKLPLGPDTAQVFVPIVFTIGAAGQPAQPTRFLMNQVLVKTAEGWRVSSILPIPAPAP